MLSGVEPDAGRDYLAASTASARADFAAWFWEHRPDSLPLSREDYLSRARQARGFFGQTDLIGDDRVPVYVRFGPPRREVYDPTQFRSETLTIVVNPAEVWTYDSAGFQFDFVKTGTAFKLAGESRFGPAVVVPSLEEVDLGRTPPRPGPEARSAGL
jgi:hypothetical protein